MRKLIFGILTGVTVLGLAACGLSPTQPGYHSYGVVTQSSSAILFLNPESLSHRKVYIKVDNQSGTDALKGLRQALIKQLQSQQFTVATSLKTANYQANIYIKRVGVMTVDAANSVLTQGFGGGIYSAGKVVLGKKMFDGIVAKSPEELAAVCDVVLAKRANDKGLPVGKQWETQQTRIISIYKNRLPTKFSSVAPEFNQSIARFVGSAF
jgi:hypothetical protein